MFTREIPGILDEMAPMKTFQVRSKHAPWFSDKTVSLM